MASGLDPNQTNFFVQRNELDTTPAHFAELCTALYERELMTLATSLPDDKSLIQQRIRGLPHHIRHAAHFMARQISPLKLDSHNAAWLAKQSGKCPADKITGDATHQWLERYAAPGLVACVLVEHYDASHIELDSIDRIDSEKEQVHVNKYRWFSFDGEAQASRSQYARLTLLKPTKATVSAACCGHRWNLRGKVSPRTLSLRELLLASSLDWKHFRYPVKFQLD